MLNLKYFTLPGCGQCRLFKPIVSKLANELQLNVEYIDCSLDTSYELYKVTNVPTLIICREGQEVERIDKYIPEITLKSILQKYL